MSNLCLSAFADESSPFINGQIGALNRNNIGYFEEHLDLFKQNLETAKIMDAKCIRLFSFFTNEFTPAVKYAVF